MSKKELLGALTLAILAGCAHPEATMAVREAGPMAKPAVSAESWSTYERRAAREAPLDVKDCLAEGDQVCIVTIDIAATCDPKRKPVPEYLRVKPNQHIVWHIHGTQWDFVGPGILWQSSSPATLQGSGPQVRHWKVNGNAAGGYYPYHVQVTDGKSTCEIDPGLWV